MYGITTDSNNKITVDTDELLSSVKETIKELEDEINVFRLKKECPFYCTFGNKIKCPYKDGWHTCFDIEAAPGNGDAWCTIMIDRSIDFSDDNHDDEEWKGDNNV